VDRGRKILVVDDAALFRDLGAVFLARSGRVLTAASGDEALRVARRVRPDLVLSDFHMPGMDGAALCEAIKSDPEIGHTPVILVLAGSDPSERPRAVRAGADDLLAKPLSRIALLEAVNRLLRQDALCGLPRIEVRAPVALDVGREQQWGTVRNLSRGGLFVESECALRQHTEVGIRFTLPDTGTELESTAEVVWSRAPSAPSSTDEAASREPGRIGMGMRFLELDAPAMRSLDDYIFERAVGRAWSHLGGTP